MRGMTTQRTASEHVYSILYSYPTWDPYYRGQRGVRVPATSEQDAIQKIRDGFGGYPKCPDAQIVAAKLSANQS